MKVLISGSTGLLGEALVEALKVKNHHVARLVRGKRGSGDAEIVWDPKTGQLNPAELVDIDAVVNLSGENIAGGRWSSERKEKIKNSRIEATTLLSETIAKMENPPKVFLSASAIGYYGDRPGTTLSEVSASGSGFLPETCRLWEKATQPAKDKGVRVVNYRIGVVLSAKGGALKAMYWPFQLGLAGNLSLLGKQYMSWIALDDLVGGLIHCLENQALQGPVNATAPNPVTNAQFTDAMRRRLINPIFPMRYWTPPLPGLAVEALLGEMGKELLLADIRVMPVRLSETGYLFKFPTVERALHHEL